MENNTTANTVNENAYKIYGTVRDAHQQPMSNVTVKVTDHGIRRKKVIAQAVTAADGTYTINFTLKSPDTAALIVAVYDAKGNLLEQNEAQYNIPAEQQVDFDLSGKPFAGLDRYNQLQSMILPFSAETTLAKMTETADDPDISFVAKKTGLPTSIVEQMAMAARFETFCTIPATVWFGILSQGVPALTKPSTDLDAKLTAAFDALMHTPVNKLIETLKKAVDSNQIASNVIADTDELRKQLNDQLLAYAKKHPVTGEPSPLYQKAVLAGIKGRSLTDVIASMIGHTGSEADLWDSLDDPKNSESLQAVFKVDSLTGGQLPLTGALVKNEKITSPADIRKLAGYTAKDWAALLKKNKIKAQPETNGKTETEKLNNYAGQLETRFAKAFPTAAFTARMSKDDKHKLPNHDKVSAFLQANPDFDLLRHQVGTFIDQNKKAVVEKDAPDVTDSIRRIQRVFRLTSSYDGAKTLLNDNIHSAHQVFKIGKANFVKNYGDKLGQQQAEQIFDKADTIHANAIAFTNDLRSMVDASAMNAFPDLSASITTKLATDLPDLETLFGQSNYFDRNECSSVYGAPAYLTDILHYLDKRHSTLPAVGGKTPSVKDVLLMRRPDIGDIDLNCDNANTEVPYIDIACEIMEEYIASSVAVIASSSQALLTKGVINATLLTNIKAQLTAIGQTSASNLLTAAATVSEAYTVNHLQADNTFRLQTHWIIRDTKIVIKASATSTTSTVAIKVLNQTLLSADTISAGPEYVNASVYTNFLNTAKAPFSLPFDLYETEGELHLEKLGIKKAELLDIFRKEDHTAPGTSFTDVKVGYATLGISLAEQTLIFVADPTHQSLYWGNAAASTTIQVDVFERLSGLTYSQVYDLIQLQFINPAKDTVIEHDTLNANTSQQRLLNVTPAKLDAMHRFLRLWRKTSFTMYELDAIIMSPVIGKGTLQSKLPFQLLQFTTLQQKLQLNVSQLLAFYQNIDTTHNLPDSLYNQVFQNIAITNPVNANFSLANATAGTLNLAETDKPVLAAILQVSVNDVNALITRLSSSAAKVSLALFSSLYRYAQLAQALTISVTDLLNLTYLIDANPFLDLQSTSLFLQKYDTLRSSGLSIDDLNYILRHQDDLGHTLVPATDVITKALTQLQNDLLAARVTSQPAVDVNGTLLSQWLSDGMFNWDPGLLNRLTDILNTTDDTAYKQKLTDNSSFLLNLRMVYHDTRSTTPLSALPLVAAGGAPITFPAPMNSQLIFDNNTRSLTLTGYMSAADKTALLALSKDTAYHAAINTLYNRSQQTDSSTANIFFATAADVTTGLAGILNGDTATRFAFFINKLAPVYTKLLQQNVVIKDISDWFGIDSSLVSQALVSIPAIYTDLTADDFVNKIAISATQTTRYQFIAKLLFVAGRLKLTAADLAFLLPYATGVACLDLKALPLTAVSTAVTTFPGLGSLVDLLKFQQYYPAKVTDVVNNTTLSVYSIMHDAIAQGSTALTGTALTNYGNNLVKDLSLLTGWNVADLTTLIGPASNIITLILAKDIRSVAILMRLHQRITKQQQLGLSIADAFAWTKDAYTAADVAKIKQTLKQGYSSSDWVQVSQTIQNTLREKKRDALIAYLLANPGTKTWKTADDLYNYFLLDVQMCSCQPTTRIVQATNTVQLFVQRSFMSLEANILVDTAVDPDWNQWQWMKNFRLWQANMKVFLYPENYIEPELLPVDVKSSFLTDLENELLQNEVTAENAGIAFENYLNKLREVSRLEIKNQWYDDASQTLHVLGRTYGGDPKVYYHRKFIAGKRWTPWEKIDLDINSEFIMPVVYNSHLYIFWALIKSVSGPSGNKQWQIQLAYSEFRNGKWSAKKTSENNELGQIICDQVTYPDITRFVFTPIDIPIIDYDWLTAFIHAGPPPFWTTMKNAALKPGSLAINCFYYHKDAPFEKYYPYISSFQLDVAKGYPLKVNISTNIFFELKTWVKADPWVTASNPPIQKNIVNMYLAELNPPLGNGWPGLTNSILPDQSRGAYTKTIPLQMGAADRGGFLYATSQILPGLGGFGDFHPGNLIPYFYQDKHRTYFIIPEVTNNSDFEYRYEDDVRYMVSYFDAEQQLPNDGYYLEAGSKANAPDVNYRERYFNFYHTNNDYFMQRLFTNGIDGLMDRQTQLKGDAIYDNSTDKFSFATYYKDLLFDANQVDLKNIYTGSGNSALPIEDVDFNLQSGYGAYNWEIFYHAPLMIAERLSQNQQFDEADRWYRYIFNPMDSSANPAPNKYWNTKPFFETTSQDYLNQRIDQILLGVKNPADPLYQDLLKDITDWRNNPFQPHYIAQYRTVTYQKVAVMKYVGHLIRYGDNLFGQDTMEAVNQATQLYILASEILGPKPEILPAIAKPVVDNYYQLEQKLDNMSDAVVNVENLLPLNTLKQTGAPTPVAAGTRTLSGMQSTYFGVPANENMVGATGYWDIINDRLFKIRHCLNIDGTVAPLSIFAPVIDPALLVRATAAGLDLGSILNDLNAPLPFYRFGMMVQKAIDLSNEVRSLGSSMLSVLEKKDAESMSLLRSGQEIKLLNAVAVLKQKQIDDAQAVLDGLNKQKQLITVREKYYRDLLNNGLSNWEKGALILNGASVALDAAIIVSYLTGSVVAAAPINTIGLISGAAGGAVTLASEGGTNASESASNMARNLGSVATGIDKVAAMTSVNANYERRKQEWQYQLDAANAELDQIQKQIDSAFIRLSIANQDALNQQLQISQAEETNEFMQDKFTNEDLYNWMITQSSGTYFKAYQLAYSVAKKAERCFRYELGLDNSSYINFGYWDNLKKGLLAGDKLSFDLKQMEMAYFDQNKRELELIKPISVSQLDPVALLKLKTTRQCFINLPEELFDMDHPGHYMRRIKSVSLTIPCITGPYTTVSCKLTLVKSSVRASSLASGQYQRKATGDDPRFRDMTAPVQSIATSSAQNDSGMFELNFRDERYLPFEGAGAVSLWHLELPSVFDQFDHDTISDVIINLRYTARDGGAALSTGASNNVVTNINKMLVSTQDTGLMRVFSAKTDLSTEWYKFLNPATAADDQVLTLGLDQSKFPLFVQKKTIKITAIELIADGAGPYNNLQTVPAPTNTGALNLKAGVYGSWLTLKLNYNNAAGTWSIKNPAANPRITTDKINNMVIIVHYTIA